MGRKDRASNRYFAGLTVLTGMQFYIEYSFFQKLLDIRDTAVQAADGSAAAGEQTVLPLLLVGTAAAGVLLILLTGAVMVLLRRIFRDLFGLRTRRRDFVFAVFAWIIGLAAGCLFGHFAFVPSAVILSLPVPFLSWLIFHAGKSPEDAEKAEQAILEDLYY